MSNYKNYMKYRLYLIDKLIFIKSDIITRPSNYEVTILSSDFNKDDIIGIISDIIFDSLKKTKDLKSEYKLNMESTERNLYSANHSLINNLLNIDNMLKLKLDFYEYGQFMRNQQINELLVNYRDQLNYRDYLINNTFELINNDIFRIY